jgi:hypothetical protein
MGLASSHASFYRVIKDLKGPQYFEASGGACFPGKVLGEKYPVTLRGAGSRASIPLGTRAQSSRMVDPRVWRAVRVA